MCKWFLNVFVDTLPLPSLLAVWDLLLTGRPAVLLHADAVEAQYAEAPPPLSVAPPSAAAPSTSPPSGCSDGLVRVALALIESQADALSDALSTALGACGQPDPSVAYAALLHA